MPLHFREPFAVLVFVARVSCEGEGGDGKSFCGVAYLRSTPHIPDEGDSV